MASRAEPDEPVVTARLEQHGEVDVVITCGDLDAYSVMAFRDVAAQAGLTPSPYVLVDLTDAGFLDSTGIAALVATRRRLRLQHRELGLVAPTGGALRLLKMVGIDQVLRIWPTLAEALADVGDVRGPWRG